MKNLLTIINLSIIIGITTILTQTDKIASLSEGSDEKTEMVSAGINASIPVVPAKEVASRPIVSAEAQDFLKAMTEARVMDLEQGNTASQRATTRPLKNYGILMVKDQTEMLKDLKEIAEKKNVSIPLWVGPEKADGLEDLKKLHGKDFDKKFIKMMIIDHKRDLKKLEKAIYAADADIQVFATRYLPIVQDHLEKIKALKKDH